jgi:hypothetical protein
MDFLNGVQPPELLMDMSSVVLLNKVHIQFQLTMMMIMELEELDIIVLLSSLNILEMHQHYGHKKDHIIIQEYQQLLPSLVNQLFYLNIKLTQKYNQLPSSYQVELDHIIGNVEIYLLDFSSTTEFYQVLQQLQV